MESVNKQKSIFRNLFMNFLTISMQMIYPLFSFMYVARILSAESIGKVNFSLSILSYFVLAASLGIPTYGLREIARNRDDNKKLSQVFWELLILNIAIMVIVYTLFICSIWSIPKFGQYRELFVVMSLQIVLSVLNVSWFYQGIERFDKIAFRSIIVKLIAAILLLCFVKKKEDYLWYGIIYVLSEYGTAILNLVGLREFKLGLPCKKINIFKHVPYAISFFLLSMAATIFGNLDKTMIGFMKNDLQVGLYTTGFKAVYIIYPLVIAFGGVLIPKITFFFKNEEESAALFLIRKNIIFVILCSVPLIIYFFACSTRIIDVFAGENFADSVIIMKVACAYPFLTGFWDIFQNQMLVPMGKEKTATFIVLFGVFIDFIMNIVFIPAYGGAGAALATMIAECLMFVAYLYVLKGYVKNLFSQLEYLKYFLIFLVLTVSLLFVSRIQIANSLIYLFVTFFIYILIYVTLLWIFKEELFLDILQKIKKYIEKTKFRRLGL